MSIKNKTTKAMPVGRQAFSLVEVLMATFVFSVIMVGVAGAFSGSMFGYRAAKNTQKDLEQAQFAMSLMAKTIRTSSVVVPNVNTASTGVIVIYDYSQGKCIAYQFDSTNNQITTGSAVMVKSACTLLTDAGSLSNMVSNVVDTNFAVTPSAANSVGKVTISMEVGSGSDKARLQTTVSLRDYSVSGL